MFCRPHLGFPRIITEVHHPSIQRIEAHVQHLVLQQLVPAAAAPGALGVAKGGPIRNQAFDDDLRFGILFGEFYGNFMEFLVFFGNSMGISNFFWDFSLEIILKMIG